VPDNNWKFEKPKNFWSKSKKENIIEKEARERKDLPAPNNYKLDSDWTKNTHGKFLKGKRITEVDSILS
jgi:hypothetical protein